MTNETGQAGRTSDQVFNAFGVQLQFLIEPAQTDGTTSLYRGTLPPGVVIPLHSHPEAEVFYLLDGTLQVYQESGAKQGWVTLEAGEAIAIAGGVKHAIRNVASNPATTILVTREKLYGFFREISTPIAGPPAPPTPDDMQRLMHAAMRYAYWMGSPEENAAIGISLG